MQREGVELAEPQKCDDLIVCAAWTIGAGISEEGEISEVFSQGRSGEKAQGLNKARGTPAKTN